MESDARVSHGGFGALEWQNCAVGGATDWHFLGGMQTGESLYDPLQLLEGGAGVRVLVPTTKQLVLDASRPDDHV